MDKVIVRIKGAGSLEVEGNDAKMIYTGILGYLKDGGALSVKEIKRGPKKKVMEEQ